LTAWAGGRITEVKIKPSVSHSVFGGDDSFQTR